MHLYRLDYEEYTLQDYTTSDGFGSTRECQSRVCKWISAKNDETAKAQARKLLRFAKKYANRIEEPCLARVVPLRKVKGIRTFSETRPNWKKARCINE